MHFNRNKTAEFGTWTQGNFISVCLRLTLQGAAAGLRAPCGELCLLLSGEVPGPGPLRVPSEQRRPLLLPQASPPTSPARLTVYPGDGIFGKQTFEIHETSWTAGPFSFLPDLTTKITSCGRKGQGMVSLLLRENLAVWIIF